MRYAKIYSQLWATPDFLCLSTEAKLGYMYLCSCEHCNLIGYFRLPLAYISADMGIKVDAAVRVVKELEAAGFVRYNPDTSRILIRSYLKWNGSSSPKNQQGMADLFDQLPKDDLDVDFLQNAEKYCINEFFKQSKRANSIQKQEIDTISKSDTNGIDTKSQSDTDATDTVSIEYRTQKQKQKQKQKQEYSSLRSLAPSCDDDAAPSAPTTPQPDPSQDVLLVMPCTGAGGKTWKVTRGYLDGLRDTYPGIDLMAECRKAKAWLDANPRRLKTYSGMKAFLTSWFSRAQNRLGSCLPYSQQRGTSSLPDSVIHTEDAWAGQKGGKISFGGSR